MLHSYDSIHANFICEQQNIANIFTAHTAVSNTVLVVSLTAVVEILLHSWDVRAAACSPGIMLYSFKKHIWEVFFFPDNKYLCSLPLCLEERCREIQSMTQKTPSPQWSMEVETLCFGDFFFLLRVLDNFTALRGQWARPRTQNKAPKQKRSC